MSYSDTPEDLSDHCMDSACIDPGVRGDYKMIFVPIHDDDDADEGEYVAFIAHRSFGNWDPAYWIQAAHDAVAFGTAGLDIDGVYTYYYGWPAPEWMRS